MPAFWEPYLPGSSIVHRLDPRLKIAAAFATILVASLVPAGRWWPLTALGGLVAAAVALARLPVRVMMARTALALPFVLLAALSVLWARQGEPIWSLPLGPLSLTVTREGLLALGTTLARAWISLWTAALLVATTPLPALQHALWRLRLPAVLCDTIALLIRYLFVLVEEAARLMSARASRTAGNGLSLGARARVLGNMIGSLLVRSVARAERIHAAMLARGYAGTPRAPRHLQWRPADTRAGLVWAAGLIGVLVSLIL